MSQNPYQTPLPNLYKGTRGSNLFLINSGDDGLILIDAGISNAKSTVAKMLNSIGRTFQDLKHILITHADFDHVGGLGGIVKSCHATVYASAASAPFMQAQKSPPHVIFPLSLMTGALARLQGELKVDKVVEDGEVLPLVGGIRAIATPGHTPDHFSYFWEAEKVLFAGDLLFGLQASKISFSPGIITYSKQMTRDSARKVMELAPKFICVGHGVIFQDDATHTPIATFQQALTASA